MRANSVVFLRLYLREEWHNVSTHSDTFHDVCGMVYDDQDNVLQSAKLVTNEHHLHRRDDAFLLDNRAAWMTGNASVKKLYIHFVDSSLNYERVTLY